MEGPQIPRDCLPYILCCELGFQGREGLEYMREIAKDRWLWRRIVQLVIESSVQ